MHYIHCFTHCLPITPEGALGHVSLMRFSLWCRMLTCFFLPLSYRRSNPKGIAVWICNVLFDATCRHGETEMADQNRGLVDLHSRKGKGRAAHGVWLVGATSCRPEQGLHGDMPTPPISGTCFIDEIFSVVSHADVLILPLTYPRSNPKGIAVWICNVLVDATCHHGETETADQNRGLVDFHSRKGKGRAAHGVWLVGATSCRREQGLHGDMPKPPISTRTKSSFYVNHKKYSFACIAPITCPGARKKPSCVFQNGDAFASMKPSCVKCKLSCSIGLLCGLCRKANRHVLCSVAFYQD